jgi:hypothetical protein
MRRMCKTNEMDLKERYNGYRILMSDGEKVELRHQIHTRIRFSQTLSPICWLESRKYQVQEGYNRVVIPSETAMFVSLWISKLELQA